MMAKPVSESRGTGMHMRFWYESVLRGIYIRAAGASNSTFLYGADAQRTSRVGRMQRLCLLTWTRPVF